jgi:hypothetical protein
MMMAADSHEFRLDGGKLRYVVGLISFLVGYSFLRKLRVQELLESRLGRLSWEPSSLAFELSFEIQKNYILIK